MAAVHEYHHSGVVVRENPIVNLLHACRKFPTVLRLGNANKGTYYYCNSVIAELGNCFA